MPRVLVVDDEHLIADTLSMILSRNGFEVCAAYSGEDAVSRAREFLPDAIISDVTMPGISGIQAAMRILGDLPSCRVFLFSGQASIAEQLSEARARGYDFPLLLKPLHPEAVIALLRKELEPHRVLTFPANPTLAVQ